MPELHLTHATRDNLPALLELYNHYVCTSPATFDLEPQTLEQRKHWFKQFDIHGPHQLRVARLGEQLAGYASSTQHRTKPGYDRSVETTIYMAADSMGQGLGFKLYQDLLERLEREPSVSRAFAGIVVPNEASIRLHEKCAFTSIGTFHQIGYKFDQYWDVAWYERDLR